ncbi:hypothetical protein SCYAM73S_07172 [Streptomyces cyaneofuscatus]
MGAAIPAHPADAWARTASSRSAWRWIAGSAGAPARAGLGEVRQRGEDLVVGRQDDLLDRALAFEPDPRQVVGQRGEGAVQGEEALAAPDLVPGAVGVVQAEREVGADPLGRAQQRGAPDVDPRTGAVAQEDGSGDLKVVTEQTGSRTG